MIISMQLSTTEQNVPWNPLLGLNVSLLWWFWKSKGRDSNAATPVLLALQQRHAGFIAYLAL